MAANPPSLPELVRDSQLDATTFQGDLTIHTHPLGRQIRIEKWKRHEILGQGGYGVVWLEQKVGDGAVAVRRAVKVVSNHDGWGPMHYSRELEALAKFSQEKYSDFFVKFLGWYENPESNRLHIAMEYCPHGDLKKYLASKGGRLPESHVKNITSQVLAGVVMMHRAGFANRDIKPANILIKSKPPDNWWVKICDFGLSKRAGGDSDSTATTVAGTPGFMPPEILGFSSDSCGADGFMVDMWCLGETVFQALTGKAVFDIPAAVGQYFNGDLDFPFQVLHHAKASVQAKSFIISLMRARPFQRMNGEAAARHPWMLDITLRESIRVPETQDMTAQSIGTTYQYALAQARTPGDQLTQGSGEWTTTLRLANKPRFLEQGELSASPAGHSHNIVSTANFGPRQPSYYNAIRGAVANTPPILSPGHLGGTYNAPSSNYNPNIQLQRQFQQLAIHPPTPHGPSSMLYPSQPSYILYPVAFLAPPGYRLAVTNGSLDVHTDPRQFQYTPPIPYRSPPIHPSRVSVGTGPSSCSGVSCSCRNASTVRLVTSEEAKKRTGAKKGKIGEKKIVREANVSKERQRPFRDILVLMDGGPRRTYQYHTKDAAVHMDVCSDGIEGRMESGEMAKRKSL